MPERASAWTFPAPRGSMEMNKRTLILMAGLLVGSFAISFVVSAWVIGPPPAQKPEADKDAADQAGEGETVLGPDGKPVVLSPDAMELKGLIKEVRAKKDQYRLKKQKLEQLEAQIRIARAALAGEAQKLENLRVQLVAPLDRLKQAKKDLEDTRIRIKAEELANLRATAGIYDKMSPEDSAPIFEEMCKNDQLTDAVWILRLMQARTAANVLGQISDKTVARKLMDGLKRVQQKG